MQFVFVTAISISTSETQGKLTQYQHHRKKNNRKILHHVDQPLADLHLHLQSSLITVDNRPRKQRRLSVKSLTKQIISSFPCISQPRSLHRYGPSPQT